MGSPSELCEASVKLQVSLLHLAVATGIHSFMDKNFNKINPHVPELPINLYQTDA